MSEHPLIFTNCFPCQTQTCSQEALCIWEVFFRTRPESWSSTTGSSSWCEGAAVWPRASCQCVTAWGGLDEARDWQAPSQAALGFTTTATSSKNPGQGPRAFLSQRALLKSSWQTRIKGKKKWLQNTKDETASNKTWQNKKRKTMGTWAWMHEWDLQMTKTLDGSEFWLWTHSKAIGLQEKCFWNVDGWQS